MVDFTRSGGFVVSGTLAQLSFAREISYKEHMGHTLELAREIALGVCVVPCTCTS